MVTMSDIARHTGVTVTTVSNALTNSGRVAESTRARVLAAASDLGYEVNLRARHLRVGRTDTIALIAPSFHDYFSEIADELAALVEASDRHLVLERTAARPESERSAIALSRLQMFDGVILSSVGLTSRDIERASSRVPLVLLGEQVMPASIDHILLGNEEGARLATAHMINAGARRTLILGGSTENDRGMASSRRVGWQSAHEEAGLAADPALVIQMEQYTLEDARKLVRALIRDKLSFDSVFAVTDVVALGAMSALTEAGLEIPRDVQVAGFDNIAVADYLSPGLTTVDPHRVTVAQHAVRMLDRQIADRSSPAEQIVAPASLVVRGSTR